jgi:hypothetical protein
MVVIGIKVPNVSSASLPGRFTFRKCDARHFLAATEAEQL